MKRNDASRISPINMQTCKGKYVAFISKDFPDDVDDFLFTSIILATSDTYAGVWQNEDVQNELSRINALDNTSPSTNLLNEVVVVHYLNDILTS